MSQDGSGYVVVKGQGTGGEVNPVKVASAEFMDSLLGNDANIGKIYLYTGESTEKYLKNSYYVIQPVE